MLKLLLTATYTGTYRLDTQFCMLLICNSWCQLGVGTSRIDVTVYQPQWPGYRDPHTNSINSNTSNSNSNKQLFIPEVEAQHTCYCEPDM